MEAYGDHADRANPFYWECVILNLPGEGGYQPHLPWVMKLQWDGHLATGHRGLLLRERREGDRLLPRDLLGRSPPGYHFVRKV